MSTFVRDRGNRSATKSTHWLRRKTKWGFRRKEIFPQFENSMFQRFTRAKFLDHENKRFLMSPIVLRKSFYSPGLCLTVAFPKRKREMPRVLVGTSGEKSMSSLWEEDA